MNKIFLFSLALLFPFVTIAEGSAEAEKKVKEAIDQVREIVAREKNTLSAEALDNKLRDVLVPVFDFDELSRSCLGANWNKGSVEQQSEFVGLFKTLISRTYLSKIRKNIEGATVEFTGSEVRGTRVVVRSLIRSEGEELHADYRLHQKDGVWRAYDVLIENVGLVTNYRSEFSAIVRKDGFDGLLEQLRTKVAKL